MIYDDDNDDRGLSWAGRGISVAGMWRDVGEGKRRSYKAAAGGG